MKFLTIIPSLTWCLLAFCILSYIAWGPFGVVAAAIGFMLVAI